MANEQTSKNTTQHQFVEDASADDDTDQTQGPCKCDTKYCKEQENKTRSNWFLNGQSTLALISVAFGTGVLGRVPYLMYRHGVGFLVFYVVLMAAFGGPLAYYELSMGQFSSNGILTCWPLPIFKCIGAGILSYNLPMVIMQNTMGAWALYYLHVTAQASINNTPLPWMSREDVTNDSPECGDISLWAPIDYLEFTSNCSDLFEVEDTSPSEWTEVDGVCWSDQPVSYLPNFLELDEKTPKRFAISIYNEEMVINSLWNSSDSPNHRIFPLSGAGQVYFDCNVLKKPKVRTDPWEIVTGTTVGSLVTWLIVMAIALFGVRVIGCVWTLTVPLALVLMIILFFRSGNAPGATSGTKFGFSFSTSMLWDVWFEAAQQVLYSLTLSQGILTTYGSYNRFHNNYVRDVVILGCSSAICHVFGGIMMLGIVGSLARDLDVAVAEVINSGPELIFGMASTVLGSLPESKIWCGLYFMMVFLVTLHVVVALLETFVTALLDQIPNRFRKFRPLFVAGFCVLFFLLGLPMCTPAGLDLFTLVDMNIGMYQPCLIVLLMIFCYCVYAALTYFWYRHDVVAMTGWDCCCVKSIRCWTYNTCLMIFLGTLISLGTLVYQLSRTPTPDVILDEFDPTPEMGNRHLEMVLRVYMVVVIIVVAVIQIVVAVVKKKPRIRALFTRKWKPALRQHQKLVERYRAQNVYSSQNYSPLTERS